jgi:hypothetical protein
VAGQARPFTIDRKFAGEILVVTTAVDGGVVATGAPTAVAGAGVTAALPMAGELLFGTMPVACDGLLVALPPPPQPAMKRVVNAARAYANSVLRKRVLRISFSYILNCPKRP